jgi:lipopolysaccharide transport system ATP-binding protein
MTTSIRVEDLGKAYKQYARPVDRIHDWLTIGRRPRHALTWPVRGISFSVEAGEAVGIIGQNGAGKTTLMNLIRGIIFPTTGSVFIDGSLSALDLGLGFHPDLTGRENLFAAGSLLGLSPDLLAQHVPGIEAFAEIGDYLDQPVRTYSSGMRLRLAFSLATTMRPNILVIDEALAVGDAYFQAKCVRRIRQFREEGTTLLLVSHDQAAIKAICDRALLLDRGLLIRDGDPQDVFEYYNGLIARTASEYQIRQGDELANRRGTTRHGNAHAVIDTLEVSRAGNVGSAFPVGAEIVVEVEGHADEDLDDLTVGILFRDRLGNDVYGTNTHHLETAMEPVQKGSAFSARFTLPLNLGVGSYSITASFHAGATHVYGNYDWWDGLETIQVLPGDESPFAGCCYIPTLASFKVTDRGSQDRQCPGPDREGPVAPGARGSS